MAGWCYWHSGRAACMHGRPGASQNFSKAGLAPSLIVHALPADIDDLAAGAAASVQLHHLPAGQPHRDAQLVGGGVALHILHLRLQGRQGREAGSRIASRRCSVAARLPPANALPGTAQGNCTAATGSTDRSQSCGPTCATLPPPATGMSSVTLRLVLPLMMAVELLWEKAAPTCTLPPSFWRSWLLDSMTRAARACGGQEFGQGKGLGLAAERQHASASPARCKRRGCRQRTCTSATCSCASRSCSPSAPTAPLSIDPTALPSSPPTRPPPKPASSAGGDRHVSQQ